MVLVNVVADDLTGAMDTAHGFAERGYDTSVVAAPPRDRDADAPAADVLAVNTDSRYADPDRAADAVRRAIRAAPAELVYKKVDSTLRGNVGTEVDAALAETDARLAVFAPAFPEAGRTTRAGVHYVDDVPVAETEYGQDERGPVSSSLAALFDGIGRPVATVTERDLDSGRDRVATAVSEAVEINDRPPVVVCDARSSHDLAVVADAAAGCDPLYAGSSGLAQHVPVPGAATTDAGRRPIEAGGPLGVVGSVSETTLAQLDRLPDESVIEVDPVALVAGETPADPAARAADRCDRGAVVVVTAATDRAAVDRTLDAARERGLAPETTRERVATGLAATAGRAYREAEPSGLFFTGGDVAVAGLRALGATAITLTGDAVEAGVPVGRLADGVGAGTPIVTKAGGFGSEATIVNCLELLAGNDE